MNNWIFSSDELSRLRKEASTNAKSPLTPEEELTLVRYFSHKIYERLPRFPGKVIPAAVLYLQRFYLYVSPATVSPRDLMLPVVFLSSKLNDNHNIHINFDKITKAWDISDPPSVLYDLENTILDTLRFNVDVVTPHEKFVFLVQDMFPEIAPAFKTVLNADYANELLDTATTTDAALMFTPGEVAIAVLELVLKRRVSDLNVMSMSTTTHTLPLPSSLNNKNNNNNDKILDFNSKNVVEQFNKLLPNKIKKFSNESRGNLVKIQSIILSENNVIPRSVAGEIEYKLRCFKEGIPYIHSHPNSTCPNQKCVNQESSSSSSTTTRSPSFQNISLEVSPGPFVPSRAHSVVSFSNDSRKSSTSPTTSLSPEVHPPSSLPLATTAIKNKVGSDLKRTFTNSIEKEEGEVDDDDEVEEGEIKSEDEKEEEGEIKNDFIPTKIPKITENNENNDNKI